MLSLSPNAWVVILTNVIFFMVIQTFFFILVASKQVDTVIKDKISLVKIFASHNPEVEEKIEDFLKSDKRYDIEQKAAKQKEARMQKNYALVKRYVGIPLVVITIALMFFAYNVYKKYVQDPTSWSSTDSLALILVVAAYLTEVYVYFVIIRQYNFMGDYEVASGLLTEIFTYIKNKLVD